MKDANTMTVSLTPAISERRRRLRACCARLSRQSEGQARADRR